ncbi:hypothetical protein CP533_2174 [Ophiocordyceps camponoti-saundersi (nom. inval.)]|nr:hypothetical protein CP533_2174 [Ophiocordyceps camponoti-saundersi (nom. inval.)]
MDELLETADEYGRRSRCFRDYRKAPFRFKHHLADIQATALETTDDGLVAQPGLGSCRFPEPTTACDDSIEPSNAETCHFLETDPWLPSLRNFLVPIQELDLGSFPDADVQQTFRHVISKRSCHLACTWLPLISLDNERDEGLMFPLESVRMQSSLRQESELETISLSVEVEDCLNKNIVNPTFSLLSRLSSRTNVEDVTPPLSPISDTPSPFIPGSDAAVIDLTSEPASPCTPINHQDHDDGTIGLAALDPPASTPRAEPVTSRFQHELEPSHPKLQDVVMEVPLIMTSSDAPCEFDMLKNMNLAQPVVDLIESPASTPSGKDVDMNDVISALLNGRELDPTSMAEQEQLNPADSMSRVSVPVLDFRLPKPDWMDQPWSAREHFSWLQASSPKTYKIPLLPTDGRLNSSLRWALFPGGSAATLMAEDFELSQGVINFLTIDKASRSPGSERYVVLTRTPSILEMNEDAELQESVTEADDEPRTDGFASREDEGLFQPRANSKPPSILGDRDRFNLGDALLPDSSDPNATAHLLSGFMELRAVKRRRLSPM